MGHAYGVLLVTSVFMNLNLFDLYLINEAIFIRNILWMRSLR